MEVCAHDIVVVPGEHADAVARLPVPDADGLVIRRADNPRRLLVEVRCANVVQVASQGEDAASHLVVPHLSRASRLSE